MIVSKTPLFAFMPCWAWRGFPLDKKIKRLKWAVSSHLERPSAVKYWWGSRVFCTFHHNRLTPLSMTIQLFWHSILAY